MSYFKKPYIMCYTLCHVMCYYVMPQEPVNAAWAPGKATGCIMLYCGIIINAISVILIIIIIINLIIVIIIIKIISVARPSGRRGRSRCRPAGDQYNGILDLTWILDLNSMSVSKSMFIVFLVFIIWGSDLDLYQS